MFNRIHDLVSCSKFQNFIIALIILNGITMGLETSAGIVGSYGEFLRFFDRFVITVFTIEIVLRIYVHRMMFFKDPWSVFDFGIVAISLAPASGGFEILRVLRVLRLFRLVTVVPQMRKIVMALLSTIPGMASIAGLMTLFFYVFAIMATNLYGVSHPQWFGTLGESFYTLFQIMTLESWSMGIVRPIMEVHPMAWVFFVPFIFVVTFVMINLIVAVVVDAMNVLSNKEEEHIIDEVKCSENQTLREVEKLRSEIQELKTILLRETK